MKLIGQNSISKYLSSLLFIIFLVFIFHLIYFSLGYLICYINSSNGMKLFPETFLLTKKQFSEGLFNVFTINYPFTKTSFFSAVFTPRTFWGAFIGFTYFTLFFYSSFRIMKHLSSERIFSESIYKWLKIFAINNVFFLISFIILWYFRWNLVNLIELLFIIILLIFINISVLFIMAFMKKGYEFNEDMLVVFEIFDCVYP